jgi:cyclase
VDVDDPVALASRYSKEGADELVFYDITATHEGREIFFDTLRAVADSVDIPFTIGGGIRTADDFRKALLAGADKVSVNSAAVADPSVISEAKVRFGSQCVVLSIDAKRNGASWEVYVSGGRKNTGIDAIDWAVQGQRLGAGEICINSIDADGVKEGYDTQLIEKLASVLAIPIIASGGAGKAEHFAQALKAGADAALAASVFHYGEIPIAGLKEFLRMEGIAIRPVKRSA